MELDFDYDLDEIVLIGDHYMSLRSAVIEHIERTKKGLPTTRFGTPSWIRDRVKSRDTLRPNISKRSRNYRHLMSRARCRSASN
jgi:hypothetical protein